MIAKDVMTDRVICVHADDDLLDAAKIMLQDGIGGLPVVSRDRKLVGILTEGDFLRRAEIGTEKYPPKWPEFMVHPGRLADQYTHSHGRKVADIMTRDVIAVSPLSPLEGVVALMERKKLKRLPVVDAERVVGILTRTDLLRAVAAGLSKTKSAQGDAAIRRQIEAELRQQDWDIPGVQVITQDGVVTLVGVVSHDELRSAIRVLAENIAGVTKVHEYLVVRQSS